MRLLSIEYSQYKGKPNEWKLNEFSIGDINLIVGINASGKTKILNLIKGLSTLLSNKEALQFTEGDYLVKFDDGGKEITYKLEYYNYKVVKEKLTINGMVCLDRKEDGIGNIFAEKLNTMMQFQIPENEIAVAIKRDSIQHSFLEGLHKWAENLRHYPFGTPLGRDTLVIMDKNFDRKAVNPKDTNAVVAIFKSGKEKFKSIFTNEIIKDLNTVGYFVDQIGIKQLPGVIIQGVNTSPHGIYVKEKELNDITEQIEMSQGMFRTISLIIQLNYSRMASIPSCILIDDIGEGLDYDRSTSLIKLIIEKAKSSSIQLIMSTNDRFVMNNVPLEYWSIIARTSGICSIKNYINSKEVFDSFAFTGLNNFDFFTSKYYLREKNKQ